MAFIFRLKQEESSRLKTKNPLFYRVAGPEESVLGGGHLGGRCPGREALGSERLPPRSRGWKDRRTDPTDPEGPEA